MTKPELGARYEPQIEDCEFCQKWNSASTARDWYDYKVLADLHWCHVVASLGPLVPGHMLLVTNAHYRSFSELPKPHSNELASVLSALVSESARLWGGADPLLFEHGGRQSFRRANCVEHAHFQIAPGLALLAEEIMPRPHIEVGSVAEAEAAFPGSGYVATIAGGRIRIASDDGVGTQFFRKQIRRIQGRPDDWDYLAFPEYDVIRTTIDRIESSGKFLAVARGSRSTEAE